MALLIDRYAVKQVTSHKTMGSLGAASAVP